MTKHRPDPGTDRLGGRRCRVCGLPLVQVTAYRPTRVNGVLVGTLNYRPTTWYQHRAGEAPK